MDRFIFDTHYGRCTLTDTETRLCLTWDAGRFNDTQNIDADAFGPVGPTTAQDLARHCREMADYVATNYPELV